MDKNNNPYYIKRTVDRLAQAQSYINDAAEFLNRAYKELDPVTCKMCPKEAVYNYGASNACEEHVPDNIKKATMTLKESVQGSYKEDKAGKIIIEPVK